MKEFLDRYMIRDLTQTVAFTRAQDMTPEEKVQFEEERKQAPDFDSFKKIKRLKSFIYKDL